MIRLVNIVALAILHPAATFAVNLFAAGTRGTVALLSLEVGDDGVATLSQSDVSAECGGVPSWLTLDKKNEVLYCVDDTTRAQGSLHSFDISNGKLAHIDEIDTPIGPVATTLYEGPDSQRLGIAYYHAGAIGSVAISASGEFSSPLQAIPVSLGKTGSGRQGEPHPHDAVLDPTGRFVLTPDLGSDQVRVFSISPATGELVEKAPVDVTRGLGPRHAAFHCPVVPGVGARAEAKSRCWMYLVAEISNTITTFMVSYPAEDELVLEEMEQTTTFGGDPPPRGTFGAAEIEISPDGAFVTVSNRQDGSFENSDSLATYRIMDDGTLDFVELAAAGGSGPRQFSFNKDGTMVAVGLQSDGEVAILARDVKTGEIGGEIARIGGIPSVAVVIWDE